MLVGRDAEREELSAFLSSLSEGPGILMLEGEPGIGKTTMWKEATVEAGARGMHTFSARPAEPDAALSFSALSDLLEPAFLDVEPLVPEPQARAIRVALLREASPRPADHRALSAGVLSVLRACAADGPTLLAVDDAQWLDPDSAGVIAFALRRLMSEPLGALIARRSAPGDRLPAGLDKAIERRHVRSLPIGPLSADEIALVVEQQVGRRLPRARLREIYEQSGGNPFFALELARALTRDDERPTGLSIPVPRSLRDDLVRHRFGDLTPATREVLVTAAALARPTPELLGRILPGTVVDALEQSSRAGVVQVSSEGVTFTHPLFRSAIYADASRAERHRIHAAIAEVVDDPEERARHLALAADAPDQITAAAIEAGAERARGRGALGSAADLMSHAARLTPPQEVDALVRRLRGAGEDRFRLGEVEGGMGDLRRAIDLAAPGPARAAALESLGSMESEVLRLVEARGHLEKALAEAGPDPMLACMIHSGLFWTLYSSGELKAAANHAKSALALARGEDDAVAARGYGAGMTASVLLGRGRPVELLDERPKLSELTTLDRRRIGLGRQLAWIGDLEEARAHLEGLLVEAEQHGDEVARRFLLADLADTDRRQDRWVDGLRRAREATTIAEELGTPPRDLGLLAWLEAALGDESAAEDHGQQALTVGERFELGRIRGLAALGALELARGNHEVAHRHLAPATARFFEIGIREPGWEPFHPDAIEAFLAMGDLAAAEKLVDWLAERGQALDRPGTRATASRGRGLLLSTRGDHAGAERALNEAVHLHQATSGAYEHARTLLARGSVLRRAGRKRDARGSLDQARLLFEELGAVLWTRRAESEASRIGGRRPSGGTLTEAERRVARLAAAGRTNREIADTLFMSVRTVEGHLSHVYAKLEIRSRTELGLFLDQRDES